MTLPFTLRKVWSKEQQKKKEEVKKQNLPLNKLLEWQRCWEIWQPRKILLCSRFCLLPAGLAKHFSFLRNKKQRGRQRKKKSYTVARADEIVLVKHQTPSPAATTHVPKPTALTLSPCSSSAPCLCVALVPRQVIWDCLCGCRSHTSKALLWGLSKRGWCSSLETTWPTRGKGSASAWAEETTHAALFSRHLSPAPPPTRQPPTCLHFTQWQQVTRCSPRSPGALLLPPLQQTPARMLHAQQNSHYAESTLRILLAVILNVLPEVSLSLGSCWSYTSMHTQIWRTPGELLEIMKQQ